VTISLIVDTLQHLTAMCRLLHVEWRCKHKQNIWEYCRDATAPSRTPSVTERSKQPCEAFVSAYTLTPSGPTADEYRNFCCKFSCCLNDQAATLKEVRYLEAALGIKEGEKVSRLPGVFLSRQQKALKEARRKLGLLLRRHEERCEALYYGLGVVQEGDTWRAPAEDLGSSQEKKRLSRESNESHVEDSVVVDAAGEVVNSEEQRPVEQTVEAEDVTPDRGRNCPGGGRPDC
jgi:hypothetical protein